MKTQKLASFAAATLVCAFAAHATDFSGNGDTGFGGAIGGATLTLTDDGTNVSGTLTKGSGNFNDALVIYIDSVSGGFSDTSGFNDANDPSRKAISGIDGGGNRSLMTFESGFLPDYAIALGPSDNGFGGLWQLANGGNNSLPFVASVSLNPTGTATSSTYTFSFSLSDIGLTPGAGQSFDLFGSYISNTGYRSTEAIAGNDSGTQGWQPFLQTAFGTYTTVAVPEPSTLALFGLSGLGMLLAVNRWRNSFSCRLAKQEAPRPAGLLHFSQTRRVVCQKRNGFFLKRRFNHFCGFMAWIRRKCPRRVMDFSKCLPSQPGSGINPIEETSV